jgi:hypothetical protein
MNIETGDSYYIEEPLSRQIGGGEGVTVQRYNGSTVQRFNGATA